MRLGARIGKVAMLTGVFVMLGAGVVCGLTLGTGLTARSDRGQEVVSQGPVNVTCTQVVGGAKALSAERRQR